MLPSPRRALRWRLGPALVVVVENLGRLALVVGVAGHLVVEQRVLVLPSPRRALRWRLGRRSRGRLGRRSRGRLGRRGRVGEVLASLGVGCTEGNTDAVPSVGVGGGLVIGQREHQPGGQHQQTHRQHQQPPHSQTPSAVVPVCSHLGGPLRAVELSTLEEGRGQTRRGPSKSPTVTTCPASGKYPTAFF